MPIPSRRSGALVAVALAALVGARPVRAQAPAPPPAAPASAAAQERGPQAMTPQAIQASIDALGTVDAAASSAAFAARVNAARALRRAPADAVTPALIHAVESNGNAYVRFRALVLLTSFNDARTPAVMRDIVANPNDRLRTVAYEYYEHHPAAEMIPALLQALDREESEFVRPALVRALAAQGGDPRVRDTLLQEVGRGEDYFRSAVIEAVGDYRATYALESLLQIARLGGPLQIDTVIALGKLKDQRALEALAAIQRAAPRETQPAIAAAICLLGVNCDAHLAYLIETLKFADRNPGYQELLRNTVSSLVALANSGDVRALQALFDVGIPSSDPPRAPMALGVGTVAIRNAPLMLSFLETSPKRDQAIDLVAEGFDMLEEDYGKEVFFATVRRGYWQAPEESATRKVGQMLIDKLEF
ncbi:MAG TPA: HEAT repeat domain-containing protein [Vicinamibacterales bacterium]|nr:HEAT repeat domain-containing protein [Vicinamibacterales bacterium]